MKEILRIEFTGKNINDIFSLPCVKAIRKTRWGKIIAIFNNSNFVRIGDTIVEYDNGKWGIIRKGEKI